VLAAGPGVRPRLAAQRIRGGVAQSVRRQIRKRNDVARPFERAVVVLPGVVVPVEPGSEPVTHRRAVPQSVGRAGEQLNCPVTSFDRDRCSLDRLGAGLKLAVLVERSRTVERICGRGHLVVRCVLEVRDRVTVDGPQRGSSRIAVEIVALPDDGTGCGTDGRADSSVVAGKEQGEFCALRVAKDPDLRGIDARMCQHPLDGALGVFHGDFRENVRQRIWVPEVLYRQCHEAVCCEESRSRAQLLSEPAVQEDNARRRAGPRRGMCRPDEVAAGRAALDAVSGEPTLDGRLRDLFAVDGRRQRHLVTPWEKRHLYRIGRCGHRPEQAHRIGTSIVARHRGLFS